jgi:pimeloyl-ACP methyl ester carboxylesterase
MPSFYLTYANSRFHGIREGNGAQLLICLHGFGESAAHFGALTAGLGERFTIVALDMPLHGRTEWKEERAFTPADLKAVITMVMQQEGQQRCSLLGYSMGGRLALCMVEEMAPQLQYLILVAADGIKQNPWHTFVTQTSLGNRLFKYVAYHPRLFFALLSFWHKLGLLNESVHKFAFNSMNQQEKRLQVYHVWTCMRRMIPNLKQCKQLLARYRIPALLIYGKYDRIIPYTLGERLVDGSFPGEVLVLEKGHQLLSAELGRIINDKFV